MARTSSALVLVSNATPRSGSPGTRPAAAIGLAALRRALIERAADEAILAPRQWLELLEPRRLLSGGTSGDNGLVYVRFPGDGGSAQPTASVLAPDGKLYAGGWATEPAPAGAASGWQEDLAIARLHADGSLDRSFGDDGTVVLPVTGDATVADLLLQPDGKVVVIGESTAGIAVVRLDADGSVDGTYGGGARTYQVFDGTGSYNLDDKEAAWLTPDGRLVITAIDGTDLVTLRLNDRGLPDASFAPDGYVRSTLDPDGNALGVSSLLDAEPLPGGGSGGGAFAYANEWVAAPAGDVEPVWGLSVAKLVRLRIDAGGQIVSRTPIDLGLAGDPFLSAWGGDTEYSVSLAADGSAYVTGNGRDARVAKLTPDGALDDAFGHHGFALVPGTWAAVMGVTTDGKAYVETGPDDTYYWGARDGTVRLNADGSLDAQYNGGQPVAVGADLDAVLPDGSALYGFDATTRGDGQRFGYVLVGSDGAVTGAANDVRIDVGGVAALDRIIEDGGDPATAPGDLFAHLAGQSAWNPDGDRDVFGDPATGA